MYKCTLTIDVKEVECKPRATLNEIIEFINAWKQQFGITDPNDLYCIIPDAIYVIYVGENVQFDIELM